MEIFIASIGSNQQFSPKHFLETLYQLIHSDRRWIVALGRMACFTTYDLHLCCIRSITMA